jgi:hypothetical protein
VFGDDRNKSKLRSRRDEERIKFGERLISPSTESHVFPCYKNIKINEYKTIILPVGLYGRETWSLTVREEHRLRVFENRVLRRIFRTKREELAGGWRRLYNEELHDLYASPNIDRVIKENETEWTGM